MRVYVCINWWLEKRSTREEWHINRKTLLYIPRIIIKFFFKILSEKSIDNVYDYCWKVVNERHVQISGNISFVIPNKKTRQRVKSFWIKEPETVDWLRSQGVDTEFFDLGANIGLYSIYYAEQKRERVFSFEPLPENLGVLTKNVKLNKLNHLITVVPLAMSDNTGLGAIYNQKEKPLEEGSAFVNFTTENLNERIMDQGGFSSLGMSLDTFIELFYTNPRRRIIKIDVDGNLLRILEGAKNFLNSPLTVSALVETDNLEYERILNFMKSCGFHLENTFIKTKVKNLIFKK